VVTEVSNDGTGNKTQFFDYDARGDQVGSTLTNGVNETKRYDADGRLIADVYTYASGTTVQYTNADGTFNLNIANWMSEATLYYYDADGHVTARVNYGRPLSPDWNHIAQQLDSGTITTAEEMDPPTTLPAAGASQYGLLDRHSQVTYTGYDAEGNTTGYQYQSLNLNTGVWGSVISYSNTYLKRDGYLEETTTGSGTGFTTTTDTSLYDAFGRRIAIDTHSAGQTTDQVRVFAYDAEGEILQRRDGSATNDTTFTVTANGGYSIEHYAYVNGQQIGNVDEHGTINVLGGVTGFSNSDAGTTGYVAQDGDTMQSIAQQVYGDASLWYVVADANGFSSATDAPAAGQTLKLPEVTTNSNTSTTFKPYNPNQISGSTTPSLPQAPMPAPSAHHCNALAEIVVIAVAVVVSWATYGALAPEADSWAGAVLAGAAAGAAGSAASQLAGDALGVSNGFDWGQVAVGAVGGAIGGAVASKLAGANAFARGATEGAASYVGTYETEKLVGEPAHFSWAGLVATAVGSGVAAEIGPTAAERKAGITSDTLPEKIEANIVQDVVTREVSVGLGDNHVQSWKQIGEDIFGNALGNAAVGAINEAQWKAAEPSVNKQAGAIVDSIIGDDTSSASADELPPGYGEAWENGMLFGNAGLGGIAGSTDGSAAAGDYSMNVTGDPSKAYPVPVNYTNDPAVIKALYANTVAYVNYENQQPLTYLPPVPQDANALVDYNHELQHGLYPEDYGNTLSTINVVPTSEMQQDVAAANERQAETEQALSSWQGSFGGDLAYNAVTLLTRGGNDLIAGVESVKDVLTDRMSAEQAVTGLGNGLWDVGSAIAHPVNTYNRAVGAISDWYAEPLDQKAQDIGRFGIDTLLSFGAEGIAAKGLGYIDTLADGFGGMVNGLDNEPMIGSLAAQRGSISLFGVVDESDAPFIASGARAIDPLAAFREANPISSRVLDFYQRAYNDAGVRLAAQVDAGEFADVSPRLLRAKMGQFVDRAARDQLLDALSPGGELEDLSDAVNVNRRLYYTSGRGYRIPDVYVPSEGVVLDGTIGFKNAATSQIRGFFRGGARNVLIVKPNEAPLLIPQSAWIGN